MGTESLVGLNIKQLRWIEDRLDRASVLLWDVKAAYATRLPETEREELDQAYEKTEDLRALVFRALERREEIPHDGKQEAA